jgi:hypothetical protein
MGTLLRAYWQGWERVPEAATVGKVEGRAEHLAPAAATGQTAERSPLVAEHLAPVAVRLLRARRVSVDPPGEPQLRPSGFWVEFFELLARSTALFGL